MRKNNSNNSSKKIIMNQNMAQSKFGVYKDCLTGRAEKCQYSNNFNLGPPEIICNVYVIKGHPLDIVENFCAKGMNAGIINGINPVLLCVVGNEFSGANIQSSEDMRDEIFNLRTTFNNSFSQNNPYPLKNNECVYNRSITVIRRATMEPIIPKDLYRFGLITSSPIFKPQLNNGKMKAVDFLNMASNIETIFQTAIRASHNLIILTPFGHTEDEVPQEDIVQIYNSCIFKYSHHFKYIIIGIHAENGIQLFNLFNENIIRPQELTKEIDYKYNSKLNLKLNSN